MLERLLVRCLWLNHPRAAIRRRRRPRHIEASRAIRWLDADHDPIDNLAVPSHRPRGLPRLFELDGSPVGVGSGAELDGDDGPERVAEGGDELAELRGDKAEDDDAASLDV
jgi:hypothetical protein